MRLYGKRFTKTALRRHARATAETRDAILWDLVEADRICRIKIQGSDELIIAHYPRNWSKKPHWLKEGNAVRVRHRTGIRGYTEVIGDGRALPTAVPGGTARPSPSMGGDAILSGCQVRETSPETMAVTVSSGYYRISGTIYALLGTDADYVTMNTPAEMTMGADYYMGVGIGAIDIDPADSTYFRYDILVVGTDGTIDYIAGTPASTPEIPGTPANHVRINWILVPPNATEIDNTNIGALYTEPEPVALSITYSPDDVVTFPSPCYAPPTCTIRATILDQYGNDHNPSGIVYMTLTKNFGSGNFCPSPVSDACQKYTSGYYIEWTWTWPTTKLNGTYQDDATSSPMFTVTMDDYGISNVGSLRLIDASGVYVM